MTGSFPRQQARTRRFTLGVPRAFTVVDRPDGPLVLFLRTDDGTDPITHLWRHRPGVGGATKLVDARTLGRDDELPPEERARRERAREQAGGIVAYDTDRAAEVAAFTLGGRLLTVEVATGRTAEHPTAGPAFDPRVAPDGRSVAYHAEDGLHLLELDDGPAAPGRTRELVTEPGVAWGRAEFIAAEEMGRRHGAWWAGDGRQLAVARVDEQQVARWYLADPAQPWQATTTHRYPAAGTANADVSLWVVDAGTGHRREVDWDRGRDRYLAAVRWGSGPLTLLVQPRDQRSVRVLVAEPATGATREVRAVHDDAWVELVPGTPAWAGTALVTVEDHAELGPDGTRVLCLDGTPVTPAGLQVREVVAADATTVELVVTPAHDPTRTDPARVVRQIDGTWSTELDAAASPGLRRTIPARVVEGGSGQPRVRVEVATTLTSPAPRVTVQAARDEPLEVVAETPLLTARPRLLTLTDRGLRAALLLPTDVADDAVLPVLLDPYGGPHAQRVVAAQAAHLTSQWFADQGFAVLVVDGRGSPGRGPRWERAVHHDLAGVVLEDQLAALEAAAALEPRLDRSRVAIRGWSFGGFLAALAVLRRPDAVHAAVAGAPVTDWRLYDTHYTERYLGHPAQQPEAYRRSSLVDADGQLLGAAAWDPADPPGLLLIHGLADDNVVAAHALRLSAALLAEGRAHRFLPLSGVTHMTPQEQVAEHLLTLQVAFLHEQLGTGPHAR